MTKHLPRILITPGEPAGIGPDVVIQIAKQKWLAEIVVVADKSLMEVRARQLGIPLTLTACDLDAATQQHQPGQLKILPVTLNHTPLPGVLDPQSANYVLECLTLATDLCLNQKANALVTGPVHKSNMNQANTVFTGHTEFLAERCHTDQVVMLFVVDQLKVALATIHIPLANVPQHITIEKLLGTLKILHHELQTKFGISHPKILVCGLNPHAGENGHLGREEIDVIQPVIKKCREANMDVEGPLPADTIFTPTHLQSADAILAMYHDQALPVVKYIGFDRAVNMTLGLPIIRTSVDHGTALSLAGSGQANAGSLVAAIELAITLASNGSHT
ncbi:MAG: 4-hydroxythreonine-4-phosphate dehydrogenase PdxA [Gammaproteobacteria bacterium]|nr:4-hydroxythreonine-4-phosphate dehydrogenase PdxA [Gammaproteobacteria bacterium]